MLMNENVLNSEKPSILLFVYGTLQRGENNYAWWMANPQHSTFIATGQTQKRYPLFINLLPDYPACSPCLLDKPDWMDNGNSHSNNIVMSQFVVGELFMITKTMKKWLDVLEDLEGGTYSTGEIDVIPLENYHKVEELLSVRKGETVKALAYFREKNYPHDWGSATPLSSSKLLERFSAAECLRVYGARFTGYPAHLRSAAVLGDSLKKANCPCDDSCGVPLRPKPIVLFIIDGVGDATYPELGDRTPLEVVGGVPARGPGRDARSELKLIIKNETEIEKECYRVSPGLGVVARHGVSGVMDVDRAGVSCGSDTAHLALFGYPPSQYYRGRGAYETLGAGLLLNDTDIAFKSNFAVLDEATGVVTSRRCDRDFTREGPVLCKFLNGTTITGDDEGEFKGMHTLKVQYATEHRCGIAITGEGLSHFITGTDPLTDNRTLLHCKPTVSSDHEAYEAALYTSRVVNAASKRITELLRNHSINEERRKEGKKIANVVLLRGAAIKGWVPPFAIRHGLLGFIVAPTCIIKGLGICCGLKAVDAKGATGDYHTDINSKVDAALRELGIPSTNTIATQNNNENNSIDKKENEKNLIRSNFAVIHVKGVDDAGHDRSLEKKLMMLQKCGEAMQRLWDALPEGSTMVVLADHSTPISIGDHSCEPVPVSIATKGSNFRDDVTYYSEVESTRGALGRFCGSELLGIVKRAHHWYHYLT